MYVYLITNNINNKKYVGITNDYKKRWGNEKSYPKDPKRRQVIQEAIHTYGAENFTFQVLEKGLSIEDAVTKEKELIESLNTTIENGMGYNVSLGGEYHPIPTKSQKGELNNRSKITDAEAQYILDHRDQPEYVLYEDFNEKISYDEFKQIYLHKKFLHLTTETPIYPFNFEFSCQFVKSNLDYGEVKDLREQYADGVYWRKAYEQYKDVFPNEWDFWNVYNGNRYKYVMPEVFTSERKHYHASLAKSGSNNGRAKLTEDDIRTIRSLKNNGTSLKELYSLFPQVSSATIRDIVNYKTWKNVI